MRHTSPPPPPPIFPKFVWYIFACNYYYVPASKLGSPLSKYSGATMLTSWENKAMNGSLVISTTDWNHTEYNHEGNEWQLGDQYHRLKSHRIQSWGQWMAAWWSVPQTEITQNTIMRAMNGSLVISTTDWNHTEYNHEGNEWQHGDQYHRLKSHRIWSWGQRMAAWWSVQQTEITQNMIMRSMNGSLVISTTDWNHTEYDHEETAAWWSYHRLKSYRIQWTAAWRSVQQTETIQNAITKAMNSSLVISTTDWNHTEYIHDM